MDTLAIQHRLAIFASDRDWQRDHTPKNLAMAIVREASELAEPFIWLTQGDSVRLPTEHPDVVDAVALEAADVFIYLLRLCDVLGIDLETATERKIAINAERFPIGRRHG